MNQQQEYRQLMEKIWRAHKEFAQAWDEAKRAALKNLASRNGARSQNDGFEANGIAYDAAEPFSEKRNRLIHELFINHLVPLGKDFIGGDPVAVHAIIDFLEVDIPAFRCGYAKEAYLRKLKKIPLNNEHEARLRRYGIQLCRMAHHRREIAETGRLMIRVADTNAITELRTLAASESEWVRKKSQKMLTVILQGRKDLR